MAGRSAQDAQEPVGHAVIAEEGQVLAFADTREDIARMQELLGGRHVELVERAQLQALAARNEEQQRLLSRVEARLTLAGASGSDLMARLDNALSEIANLRSLCARLDPHGAAASTSDTGPVASESEGGTETNRIRAAVKSMMQAIDQAGTTGDAKSMMLFTARRRLEAVLRQDHDHPVALQLRDVLAHLEPDSVTGCVRERDVAEAKETLQQVDDLLRFAL